MTPEYYRLLLLLLLTLQSLMAKPYGFRYQRLGSLNMEKSSWYSPGSFITVDQLSVLEGVMQATTGER